MKKLIFFIFILFLSGFCFADTHYVCNNITNCNAGGTGWSGTPADTGTCGSKTNPCLTIQYGMGQLASGDTLIIGGNMGEAAAYTGTSNIINGASLPPNGPGSGSGDARFTIIKAETAGYTWLDGEDTYFMINLDGTAENAWLLFEGFAVVNPDFNTQGSAILFDNPNMHHVYFRRTGAKVSENSTTSKSTWGVNAGDYYLFEECYSWGHGRYGWKIQGKLDESGADKTVVRRSVVRLDDAFGGGIPISGFQSYASREIEIQNSIVIDGDSSYWSDWSLSGSAFNHRKNSDDYDYSADVHFRGNIALNNLGWSKGSGDTYSWFACSQLNNPETETDNSVDDQVCVDVMAGLTATDDYEGTPIANHLTILTANNPSYDPEGDSNQGSFGTNMGLSPNWYIKNSVIDSGDKYAMRHIGDSNYNAVYTAGDVSGQTDFSTGASAGVNDYTDDNANEINIYDCFDYPVAVKSGSACDGTGEGGTDRGATVLYQYGTPGTFWGEEGYNTITETKLWPFPFEDTIRLVMRTYDVSGGPSGTRGFAANGQSLTKYIWGYLGNDIITVTGTESTTTDQSSVDAAYADVLGVDEVAPTPSSASVNGNTLSFTASEAIVTTGYDSGDCVVTGTTTGAVSVTSWSGSGASRTSTLATAMVNGETVTMACTLGAGDITDTADPANDMESFSDFSVTNDTGPVGTDNRGSGKVFNSSGAGKVYNSSGSRKIFN